MGDEFHFPLPILPEQANAKHDLPIDIPEVDTGADPRFSFGILVNHLLRFDLANGMELNGRGRDILGCVAHVCIIPFSS
jgi:hypothetical protein